MIRTLVRRALTLLVPLALQASLAASAQSQTAPAPAPERPPLVPARDAVIGYRLAPATGEGIDVRVALRAGGRALRMDLPDQSYMIVAPPTRSLILVVPLERTALDLPWADGPQALFLVDDRLRFVRKAEATVAGQRCTTWEAVGDRARTSMCITADGLVLRTANVDGQGRRNVVEAFAIRIGSVGDDAFTVPTGFERLLSAPVEQPK